jgi:hypothetical protein
MGAAGGLRFSRGRSRIYARELSRASDLLFGETGGVSVLFGVGTSAMRRDPRFMPLAARLGLVDYWRSSGPWPDFCSEPGLPYDCKVEAARLNMRRSAAQSILDRATSLRCAARCSS